MQERNQKTVLLLLSQLTSAVDKQRRDYEKLLKF